MNIVLVAINAKFIHASLAVYSLHAYLGKDKEHVTIKEFTINQSEDLIISELFGLNPDVLAFSCYIWNISLVLSIVQTFKKILPDVKIIAGGPEASFEYEGLFESGVDIVVSGEGEQAFKALVHSLINQVPIEAMPEVEIPIGKISRVYKAREVVPLADIPFSYQGTLQDFHNRLIYYETSRGCPNRCGFCLSSTTQGVRFLPISRVKMDLSKFLSAKVRRVKFVDRTFNCNKRHAMDIWAFLIQNDNGVTNFHFEIDAGLLDDEMIGLIGQARKGLFQFEIGVQSTNPKTLIAIRRNTNTQTLLANTLKLKSLGTAHLHLDLIIGLPYENYESFARSFNDTFFCFPDKLQVGHLKLLKGSALRNECERYGIQFKNNAPYEILSNDFMGFAVINKLQKIGDMVDLFYNAKGFWCFVMYMIQKFETPFDFFSALSTYWEQNSYHLVKHKKITLYTILYEFGKTNENILKVDIMAVSELLKFDMLLHENIRTFPSWIESYYQYDTKQITRTSGIHGFAYDICTWLEQMDDKKGQINLLQKEEIRVLFDYSTKKTVWRL